MSCLFGTSEPLSNSSLSSLSSNDKENVSPYHFTGICMGTHSEFETEKGPVQVVDIPQNDTNHQTLYIPIARPPTPAPSPGPGGPNAEATSSQNLLQLLTLPSLITDSAHRRRLLLELLHSLPLSDLHFIVHTIAPLLKRDFLSDLPTELALYVLTFVQEPRTLCRAMAVSRKWYVMARDETVWRGLCQSFDFGGLEEQDRGLRRGKTKAKEESLIAPLLSLSISNSSTSTDASSASTSKLFSWRRHFRVSYIIRTNWQQGGTLLGSHRLPIFPVPSPSNAPSSNNGYGTVTSLALDKDFVVVGLTNSNIKVYCAKTGLLVRTLMGHENGVWVVCLVSRGGRMDPVDRRRWQDRRLEAENEGLSHIISGDMRHALGVDEAPDQEGGADTETYWPGRPSFMSYSSIGWGQPNAIIVSGGCDKVLKVWDAKSGECIYTLPGHTATIRSLRVLHSSPIAVTGSRDATLRVWDVQRGCCLRVLEGHQDSVRCLDVCGRRAVSGSYDSTCRIWDLDTGECLHVLRGHLHQIYAVAFDGLRVASGGLDTTVRLWDATNGQCIALLQGHTALVCQLQLSPSLHLLATGGSDGRVITFSLDTYTPLHRIAAHDSSVTALQFDNDYLVTGGNDGRVRLWDVKTGRYIREMCEVSECVWKVAFGGGLGRGQGGREVLAIMSKRSRKTAIEIWSFRPNTIYLPRKQ